MTEQTSRKGSLRIAYGGLLILGMILGNKQIPIGIFAMDGGQIGYAIVLAIVAIVTETEGLKAARTLILQGLVLVAFCMALNVLIYTLPSAPQMMPERVQAFEIIAGQNTRLMVAGLISYFITTNITGLLQKLTASAPGISVAIRSSFANVAAQAVDAIVFVSLSFYGVFPLFALICGQFIAKMLLAFTLVPLAVKYGVRYARHDPHGH